VTTLVSALSVVVNAEADAQWFVGAVDSCDTPMLDTLRGRKSTGRHKASNAGDQHRPPHSQIFHSGDAGDEEMTKEELQKTIKNLRRRQICVRVSIDLLRGQWREDQKTLQELMVEAIDAGIQVQMETDEP